MAVSILGRNSQDQFRNNAHKFVYHNEFSAYKQTLTPFPSYTNDPKEAKEIEDIFAKQQDDDSYIVIKYTGSNYIGTVQNELSGL